MREKGFAHIFLIILLLLGLVAGVYLVTSGNPLKLFSKAYEPKKLVQTLIFPASHKILVLAYLPLDPKDPTKLDSSITTTGDSLTAIRSWISQENQLAVNNLTEATRYHGYKIPAAPSAINYEIADSKEFLKAVPTKMVFEQKFSDYRKMLMEDINICDYVDDNGIKDVWIWSYQTTTAVRGVSEDLIEVEPDDDFSTAMQIPTLSNISGSLSSITDVDTFKITLPKNSSTLRVKIENNVDRHAEWLELYGFDQVRIKRVLAAGKGEQILGYENLSAGTYYIKISDAFSTYNSNNRYTLTVSSFDPNDPNDLSGNGILESNMSMGRISSAYWNYSNFGDISNDHYHQNDLPQCDKTYVVYNHNYGSHLGVSNILHIYGHQIESEMKFIDSDMWLNKFTIRTGSIKGCGDVHNPPNANGGYDYQNTTIVQSDCEDWNPNRSGRSEDIDCHTWVGPGGCTDTDGGLRYYIWWMQNIPGLNNGLIYQDQQMRNWWEFMNDWDVALSSGKSFLTVIPSPSPTPSPTPLIVQTPSPSPSAQPLSSLQVISLSAGNNFIGITLDKGTDYKAASFAQDLNSAQAGTVTQISKWINGAWQTHIVGFPANNFDIKPGEGYLVKSSRYAQINLSGNKANLPSLTIGPGFNSISLPEVPTLINTAEKLVTEMKNQGINITTLSRWKDGSWRSYIPGFPAGSFEIQEGVGYYLKNATNEYKTFAVPTSSSASQVSAQIVTPTSKPSPAPFSCTSCLADINKDKNVNMTDYSYFANCKRLGIKSNPICKNADLDKDGKVGNTSLKPQDDPELKCITSQMGKKC
ncbi:hypothetical protein HY383_00060 [Candidatus Daviesbacteria bacterium]|nr:hypothetical protein [Candidatus Daviesbacteria bacterium]